MEESISVITGMTKIIEIENVSKTFTVGKQEITAVKNVDLEIHRGEIFSIIGYSGAGKSTLVRLLNGLEKATSGKITVNDQEITALSETQLATARRKIGMIFQHFNLMRSRTVFGNIEFPLKVAGWDKKRREDRVWELLEFVGLTQRAYNYPEQLSGGQKQRVGIARALAASPDVLLADEATSALDPETTAEVLKLLKRTNKELGITIVIITHEMDVVKSISDRVAVMEDGQIAELGTVFDVFVNPHAEITKKFLSTIPRGVPNAETTEVLKKKYPGPLISIQIDNHESLGTLLTQLNTIGAEPKIVYGNVDVLQDQEYGNVVLSLKEGSELENALTYIETNHTSEELHRS